MSSASRCSSEPAPKRQKPGVDEDEAVEVVVVSDAGSLTVVSGSEDPSSSDSFDDDSDDEGEIEER